MNKNLKKIGIIYIVLIIITTISKALLWLDVIKPDHIIYFEKVYMFGGIVLLISVALLIILSILLRSLNKSHFS